MAAAELRMRLAPLLLALFALAGCSVTSNPPAHIVLPDAASPVAAVDPPSVVEPSQLIINKISVNTALHPTGLAADGTIQVPDLNHVDQADWLCSDHQLNVDKPVCKIGVPPGALGPAVVLGHVDGQGGKQEGVFFNLKNLAAGDDIQIRRIDGSVLHFTVYRVQKVHKVDFNTADVYGNRTRPELVALTCTGKFQGGKIGYEDQLIVYAALAGT